MICSTTNCGTKTWRTWKSRKRKSKRRKSVSKTLARESYKTKTWLSRTVRWLRATMRSESKAKLRKNPTRKKMRKWPRLQTRAKETPTTKRRNRRSDSTTSLYLLSRRSHSQKILSLSQVTKCQTKKTPNRVKRTQSTLSLKSKWRVSKTKKTQAQTRMKNLWT